MKGGGLKESEKVFQIFWLIGKTYHCVANDKNELFNFETQDKLKVPFKFFVTLS